MTDAITDEVLEPGQTITHCPKCRYWLRGLPARGRCPECGTLYDKFNWGLWRKGRRLVMARVAILPRRCVKCNAEVESTSFRQRLYWHHPAIYLLLLVNLFIYILVALIVRKRAVVHVGLCPFHRRRRRAAIAVVSLMLCCALAALFLSINAGWGRIAIVSLILLVLAVIVWWLRARVLTATRMDKDFLWLSGVHRDYLATLPDLSRLSRTTA